MGYTREQMAELGLLPLYVRRSVLLELSSTATSAIEAEHESRQPVASNTSPISDARAAALAIVKAKTAPIVPAGKEPAKIVTPIKAPTANAVHSDAQNADWAQLKQLVIDCKACSLCEQRKQTVFGIGNEKPGASTWLFVGEGPGADEDEQGEPFVGQAGKLLESMLFAAGLKRGREVYIANVVKCRPPGNRQPTADEATACASFLDRQIALIQPQIIVALGRTAVTRLVGRDITMGEARGQRFENAGIPVVATYHPSYLLRTPSDKRKAWDDLLFAKQIFKSLT